MSQARLRPGTLTDIPDLVALEDSSFSTDQLAARNFRRFLRGGRCELLVAEVGGRFAGYVLVLFRANVKAGRLYSIAVSPSARGRGVGELLLAGAERAVVARGKQAMRLEVRPDNTGALRLYEKNGYRVFGSYPGFYEDGTDALRLEKQLA